MAATSFRSVVTTGETLVVPGVFDGLSARLAQRVGFSTMFIGGFPVVGTRYGVPDIGLKGLGEISTAVRDILGASTLPAFVDMDDGYGDAKCAVHALHTYELMGASAIMIEDQQWPKRCGHLDGKRVVPMEQHAEKIRAVCTERRNSDTFIVARTDARAPLGLDEALRRGEAYVKAGADALFIEAPQNLKEFEIIGRSFDVPLLANPLEGGKSPVLKPAEYGELGLNILVYGLHMLIRVAKVMEDSLRDLKSGAFAMSYEETAMPFSDYLDVVGLPGWQAIEKRASES